MLFDDIDVMDVILYCRRLQLPFRIHMKSYYLFGAGQPPIEVLKVLSLQTSDAVCFVICNTIEKNLLHMSPTGFDGNSATQTRVSRPHCAVDSRLRKDCRRKRT